MKRASLLSGMLLLWAAAPVHAAYVRGSVYLTPLDGYSFASWGSASYHNDLGAEDSSVALGGSHTVNGGSTVFQHQVSGAGSYSYALEGPTVPDTCYSTSLYVTADPPGWFNSIEETFDGDESRCTAPSPGTTIEVVGDRCDGEAGMHQPCSPIIINLGEGGFRLAGAEDPVSFDITADGWPNRITWTAAGSSLAFLARDRNANGRIDDGSELFGDRTPLSTGERAANGFEALREFDTNEDGVVDRDDHGWSTLLLWVDDDHDGVSQSRELQRLADSDVVAFETAYHWTGRRDAAGNTFKYESLVHTARGTRPAYDVYFIEVR